MQEHQINEVGIDEVEQDEMWSFVHDNSQQYWLWRTMDHQTGVPPAYCFGMRRFSKLHLMHDIVVGLVINCRLFGKTLPFHPI